MVRVDAAVVREFLAALGRSAPAGEGRPPPAAVAVRAADGEATLAGRVAGVALTRRTPTPDGPAAFAVPAADLRAAAAGATGLVALAPAGGGSAGASPLTPADPPPAAWQPAGAEFVRAMRDAAATAGRRADPRYAYHRVLVDGPAGKVVATDGGNLFARGGFAWAAADPVAVPAVGVWAAAFWAEAGGPGVAFAPDAVHVRAGPWAVALPVDRAARFPRYGEILARLRAPAARVTLAEGDAAAWAAALAARGKGGPADDPVTVALADPPALTIGPNTRAVAAGSAFAGRRAVRVGTAARPLARALALGFRTLTAVGTGHPLVALDGPRRFVWATLDPPPRRPGPRPG